MIKFRTIPHLLEIFVLPEIEKRLKSGQIRDGELPIELYQFRAIQRKMPDGKISINLFSPYRKCEIQLSFFFLPAKALIVS